ncbi:QRFP-like peptide receptor [Glandiceps talaboti]
MGFIESSNTTLIASASVDQVFDNSTNPNNDTSIEAPPVQTWLPVVLAYSITFVVGLVGNVLVIYSIQKCRRLQNVTNTFLASLAAADLIIIAIVIPIQTPAYFSRKWIMGEFLCKLLPYLTLLSSSCSVFMLTALSVERYFVIVHPLLAKSVVTPGRARRVIISLWLLAILYSFPPLYFRTHRKWAFEGIPVYYTCNTEWPNAHLGKAYSLYLLLGMYMIPLFIMTFCYSRIIYELWISTKRCRQMQIIQRRTYQSSPMPSRCNSQANGIDVPVNVTVNGMAETDESTAEMEYEDPQYTKKKVDIDQGRKQVIIMLAVAVTLFMVCWGPVLWLVVLIEFGHVSKYSPIKTYLAIAFNLLSYLNSCMNPICYAFISRTFRECFYWALSSGCQGTGPGGMATSTYVTKSAVTSLYLQRLKNSDYTVTPDASPMLQRRESPNPSPYLGGRPMHGRNEIRPLGSQSPASSRRSPNPSPFLGRRE